MTEAVVESLEIATALIGVRYKGEDAAVLLARCNAWCKVDHASEIRDTFKGSRMLWWQLDLLDKARDRVEAVRLNCLQMVRGQ